MRYKDPVGKEKRQFDKSIQQIKVSVIARVKKELGLENHENPNVIQDQDQDLEIGAQALLSEETFFQAVRDEIVELIVQERNNLETHYEGQFDRIKNLNFQLRKGFLKELNLLRETHFMLHTQQLTREDAKKYSKSQFYQFDEGLDEKIIDLLNEKIAQVAQEYMSTIHSQAEDVARLNLMISRYKQLTPKQFMLLELTTDEIFEGLSKINQDAFHVFGCLQQYYPPNFFVGAIEDTYGAFFDPSYEKKIQMEINKISHSSVQQVDEMSKNFEKEKQFEKNLYEQKRKKIDELQLDYNKKLFMIEQKVNTKIEDMINFDRQKVLLKHQNQIDILSLQVSQLQGKYNVLKKINQDKEVRYTWAKWHMMTKILAGQEGTVDPIKLKALLTMDELTKVKNSLQSRQQQMDFLKDQNNDILYENDLLRDKVSELQKKNMLLQNKFDIFNSDYFTLYSYAYENILPHINTLIQEKTILEKQVKQTLELAQKSELRATLLEEKYNKKLKKTTVDPKLRVFTKLITEFQLENLSSQVLMTQKLKISAISEVEVPQVQQDNQNQSQVKNSGIQIKKESIGCQTILQNLEKNLEYALETSEYNSTQLKKMFYLNQQKKQNMHMDTQTDLDYFVMEEMSQAFTTQHLLMTDNKFKDIRMEAFNNKDINEIFSRQGLDQYDKAQQNIKQLVGNNLLSKFKSKKGSLDSQLTNTKKQASQDERLETLIEKEQITQLTSLDQASDFPKKLDFMDQLLATLSHEERFDRVKFVFETSLDIIQIFVEEHPDIYIDTLRRVKNQLIQEWDYDRKFIPKQPRNKYSYELWLNEFGGDINATLKRLYPVNQPDVFLRLNRSLEDRELRKRCFIEDQQKQKYQLQFKTLQKPLTTRNINNGIKKLKNPFVDIQKTKQLLQLQAEKLNEEMQQNVKVKQNSPVQGKKIRLQPKIKEQKQADPRLSKVLTPQRLDQILEICNKNQNRMFTIPTNHESTRSFNNLYIRNSESFEYSNIPKFTINIPGNLKNALDQNKHSTIRDSETALVSKKSVQSFLINKLVNIQLKNVPSEHDAGSKGQTQDIIELAMQIQNDQDNISSLQPIKLDKSPAVSERIILHDQFDQIKSSHPKELISARFHQSSIKQNEKENSSLKSGDASARNVISNPIYEASVKLKINETKSKEKNLIQSKRRSNYSNLVASASKESQLSVFQQNLMPNQQLGQILIDELGQLTSQQKSLQNRYYMSPSNNNQSAQFELSKRKYTDLRFSSLEGLSNNDSMIHIQMQANMTPTASLNQLKNQIRDSRENNLRKDIFDKGRNSILGLVNENAATMEVPNSYQNQKNRNNSQIISSYQEKQYFSDKSHKNKYDLANQYAIDVNGQIFNLDNHIDHQQLSLNNTFSNFSNFNLINQIGSPFIPIRNKSIQGIQLNSFNPQIEEKAKQQTAKQRPKSSKLQNKSFRTNSGYARFKDQKSKPKNIFQQQLKTLQTDKQLAIQIHGEGWNKDKNLKPALTVSPGMSQGHSHSDVIGNINLQNASSRYSSNLFKDGIKPHLKQDIAEFKNGSSLGQGNYTITNYTQQSEETPMEVFNRNNKKIAVSYDTNTIKYNNTVRQQQHSTQRIYHKNIATFPLRTLNEESQSLIEPDSIRRSQEQSHLKILNFAQQSYESKDQTIIVYQKNQNDQLNEASQYSLNQEEDVIVQHTLPTYVESQKRLIGKEITNTTNSSQNVVIKPNLRSKTKVSRATKLAQTLNQDIKQSTTVLDLQKGSSKQVFSPQAKPQSNFYINNVFKDRPLSGIFIQAIGHNPYRANHFHKV